VKSFLISFSANSPAMMEETLMIRARIVFFFRMSLCARSRRSPKTSSSFSVTPMGWSSPS
jgi:hypothetical protein